MGDPSPRGRLQGGSLQLEGRTARAGGGDGKGLAGKRKTEARLAISRKLDRSCRPKLEQMDSGWYWTPHCGLCACLTAMSVWLPSGSGAKANGLRQEGRLPSEHATAKE
mmetsp:Transcript_100682/g.260626  ORF Transcript_100682/g.260626 Transcript_100682/m.260626 type:complete len:109 (-) Transcript_100682:672-998(-)